MGTLFQWCIGEGKLSTRETYLTMSRCSSILKYNRNTFNHFGNVLQQPRFNDAQNRRAIVHICTRYACDHWAAISLIFVFKMREIAMITIQYLPRPHTWTNVNSSNAQPRWDRNLRPSCECANWWTQHRCQNACELSPSSYRIWEGKTNNINSESS